jgi:hypothetical protein
MPTRLPEWTEADAGELRRFMAGDTGQKLGVMLRHLIVSQALGAVSDRSQEVSWRCGHASGVRFAAETIDSMGRWEGEKGTPEDGRPSDNLNWLHGNEDDKR